MDDGVEQCESYSGPEPLVRHLEELAFPDSVITREVLPFGGTLLSVVGGIFVAGGGDITRNKCKIYRLLFNKTREHDVYVQASNAKGCPSVLNMVYPESVGERKLKRMRSI